MTARTISRFFKLLDREAQLDCGVILTGASAGALMGHVRPSVDIDFEIRLRARSSKKMKVKLTQAIDKASKLTGIAVNYSEHIGDWSQISYLDYRKTAIPYKRIGKIRIKTIAPAYWTIGKMARFFALDIDDLVQVIRAKRLKPETLARIWAKAIRSSPLSFELGQFQDHVLYFFATYGKKIWKRKDMGKIVRLFRSEIKA